MLNLLNQIMYQENDAARPWGLYFQDSAPKPHPFISLPIQSGGFETMWWTIRISIYNFFFILFKPGIFHACLIVWCILSGSYEELWVLLQPMSWITSINTDPIHNKNLIENQKKKSRPTAKWINKTKKKRC